MKLLNALWFRMWLVGCISMPIGFIGVVRQIGLWPALQSAFVLHPLVNSAMFLAAYLVFAYMFFHYARDHIRNWTD